MRSTKIYLAQRLRKSALFCSMSEASGDIANGIMLWTKVENCGLVVVLIDLCHFFDVYLAEMVIS